MRNGRRRRDKQAGRVIVNLLGDRGEILFPDRGRTPLKIFIRKYRPQRGPTYGSHMDGRHKLG